MTDKAYFAAGCFWGVQKSFDEMGGVVETTVGYMGGDVESPTYEKVCAGGTGHAESTEIVFDPEEVSYEDLVRKFFELHDPTQLNHQGPDVGHQYRSAIFYTTDEQKEIAEEAARELGESGKYDLPIVTEIVPAPEFWPAEDYHQKYYIAHPGIC